uniref:CYtochrome P450 family n=1 Tax=Plectus sambesii TaxID=2011161 RepID=A0A914WWD8_9BILA
MIPTWILVLIGYLIYYVYNFYKKVAKYPPGPTPLPLIGNLHQVETYNTHKQYERWSKVYGPVFTVFFPAPTVIITQLPEIKEALIKNGDVFADRPQGLLSDLSKIVEIGGVISSSGSSWHEQRRFAVHTLREFGMGRNVMEEKIMNSVETLFEQLDGSVAAELLDMNWPITLCVGNVINELLLGYHWRADDCEKFVHFKEAFDRLFCQMYERKSVMLVKSYPWLKHVPYIGYIGFHEPRENIGELIDFLASEVEEHKKNLDYNSEPTNFVGAYLQELKRRERKGESNENLTESNLVNTLSDFWMAGMETTATTLRWAILFLITHQDVQKKMQKEIDDVVGRDRRPTMADKMNMPYTSAVVMEIQRKGNIVTFNIPRCPSADTEIGGHSIPAGTTVLPQITSVLDDPESFANPDRFDPTRFLESDGKTFNKTAIDRLVPFGLGKRQCAGEPLARMELFLILVSLMQRYSFGVPKGGSMPDLTPIFGATQNPLPYECKITLRA